MWVVVHFDDAVYSMMLVASIFPLLPQGADFEPWGKYLDNFEVSLPNLQFFWEVTKATTAAATS